MGTPTVSRRDFFRSLTLKNQQPPLPDSDDPLFDKYSRKTLGPRAYSNQFVAYNNNAQARMNEDAARIGNITSGLAPYTGPWTDRHALHLSRRINFGYKKANVNALAAVSMNSAVDTVLNVTNAVPAPPVNWYQNVNPDAAGVPYGSTWINSAMDPSPYTNQTLVQAQQDTNYYRMDGLRTWLYGLATNQENTIREKMTWFWYHFIPIDFDAVVQSPNEFTNQNAARILYSYMKALRDNATGNFKTLIRNIATQPSMMFYLNNQANTATAPDENFARELMELFTLGKDPATAYTQADVIAAAKVVSGWRVQGLQTTNVATNFVASEHNTSVKQFSSFFNNTVIQNPTPSNPAGGAAELDLLIDMIFAKSTIVSQYICRRLYRYFVYYDIDANIEANVIVPLAQTFVTNNWNIKPVLEQLFKSQHFYDPANFGVSIKSPFDFIIGTLRSFNMQTNVSDPSNHQAQHEVHGVFNGYLGSIMDQVMGNIPNVSGWKAYYQVPAFHQYWINTNTIQKRFAFIRDFFNGYGYTLNYNGIETIVKADFIPWIQQFAPATIANPNTLVAECLKYILPVDLDQTQKDLIKQETLLYQQASDSYWTGAWNNYLNNPTNASYKSIVEGRLKELINRIVQLAEYQLM
jgi:uncharacterized protein (DUF1800 family)